MEIYSKLIIIRLIYSDFILFCQFWLINAKTRWEFRTHSFLFSCLVLFYNAVRFISVLFFLLLFFPISSLHFPSALFSSLLSYSVPDSRSPIFYPQSPIMKIVQIVRFLTSLLQKLSNLDENLKKIGQKYSQHQRRLNGCNRYLCTTSIWWAKFTNSKCFKRK